MSKDIVEINKSRGREVKVFCSRCNGIVNHVVMQSVDSNGKEGIMFGEEYVGEIGWSNSYQIIKCQGCDNITFRHLNWFSEKENPWDDGRTEHLYPQRSIHNRNVKTENKLPSLLHEIYAETIECFNNDLGILCAVGLRTMIEGICAEQKIEDGPIFKKDGTPALQKDGTPVRTTNLKGKIGGLYENELLSKKNAEILHQHRYLGNEATHELRAPSKEVLSLALDIIEHLIKDIYDIPDKADSLKRKRECQLIKRKQN